MASTTSTTSTTSRMWYRRPTHQEDHHRRPTHQEGHQRRPTHQKDHHRLPPHQERYLQVPTINQKRRTPSHQPRYTPINEGFTTLVKLLFRYVQLNHHFENWQTLPKSINRDVEKLFGSIKPPCPSQKLDLSLKALTAKAKDDMRNLIDQHIHDQISDTMNALGAIAYNKDCDQAAHIAQQQLKRFGKRMTSDYIHKTLLQGLDVLGYSPEFDNSSTGSDFNFEDENCEEEIIIQEQEIQMESDLQEIVMASDLPVTLPVTPPRNPPSTEKEEVSISTTTTTQNIDKSYAAQLKKNTDKSGATQLKKFNLTQTPLISIPPLQRDRNGNPMFKQILPISNTIQKTEPLKKQESRTSIESKASSTSGDSTSRRLSQPTTQRDVTNKKKMEAETIRWR